MAREEGKGGSVIWHQEEQRGGSIWAVAGGLEIVKMKAGVGGGVSPANIGRSPQHLYRRHRAAHLHARTAAWRDACMAGMVSIFRHPRENKGVWRELR